MWKPRMAGLDTDTDPDTDPDTDQDTDLDMDMVMIMIMSMNIIITDTAITIMDTGQDTIGLHVIRCPAMESII